MSVDNHELLRKAVSGDADALTSLLVAYAPRVRASISGQIPAKWQSVLSEDDVMQQTYADAFTSISAFDPNEDGSFAGWLSRLAQCNLSDAIRMLKTMKRGGHVARVTEDHNQSSSVQIVNLLMTTSTSPSGRAAAREWDTRLKQAVKSLPPTYRTVVEMYDLNGADIATIAEALSRSVGAIYMLRARAHDRLRKLLGGTE